MTEAAKGLPWSDCRVRCGAARPPFEKQAPARRDEPANGLDVGRPWRGQHHVKAAAVEHESEGAFEPTAEHIVLKEPHHLPLICRASSGATRARLRSVDGYVGFRTMVREALQGVVIESFYGFGD